MPKQLKAPTSIRLSDLAISELRVLTETMNMSASELIGLLIDRQAQRQYQLWYATEMSENDPSKPEDPAHSFESWLERNNYGRISK